MEVFTGSADHTTAMNPEQVNLHLKDKHSPSATDILESNLLNPPLPYTVAAAATMNRRQQRWTDRRVNKLKRAFRRPEIGDLKHELATLDINKQIRAHYITYDSIK